MSQHEKEQNFSERLRKEIERDGSNKGQIAKDIGISAVSLSRYLKDRIPNTETLNNLASRLRVTSSWLLTGKGEKTPANLAAVLEYKAAGNIRPSIKTTDSKEVLSILDAVVIADSNQYQLIVIAEYLQANQPEGYNDLLQKVLKLMKNNLNKPNS